MNRIIERVKFNELSIPRAEKLILRILPTLTPLGYEHILYAISSCDSESADYVENIYPNFAKEYGVL